MEAKNIFAFDLEIRDLFFKFCNDVVNKCTLNIMEDGGRIIDSLEMVPSKFYFQEICGEMVMIFTKNKSLTTLIDTNLSMTLKKLTPKGVRIVYVMK